MSFNNEVALKDVSEYSKEKIDIEEISILNYVSTENLVPDIGGKVLSSGLPGKGKIAKYRKGDILISNIRPYFKKIWRADNDGGSSNDVLVLKAKKNIYDKFLYYNLACSEFFDFVMTGAKGTKMPRGDKNHILDYRLNLPSIQEQKAIAHILSTLDEKIEVNNLINKTLENMAQTIFKQWFVDFEFPNEDREPYKSSGGEMVESELGLIPKWWEVGRIYSIADITYGAPFSSKLFNEVGEGLPLIRIRDLKSGEPQFYTTEEHKKGTIIIPGDILIGMDAEFRPTIWNGKRAYLNQRVCLIKSNKDYVHDYYLYELIKPHMQFFEFSKVGTTVIHLSKSDIDSIKVIIPSTNYLEIFNKIIDPLHGKLVSLSIENRKLRELRDILLPKLMSGEIRVPLDEEGDAS